MAELAPDYGCDIKFISVPSVRFPLAAIHMRRSLRQASAMGAQALVIDSIAAVFLGMRSRLPTGIPMIGSLHQPPGGIDHGVTRTRIQAPLDRRAYLSCRILIAASESLASDLALAGLPPDRIRVVPPGRDVVSASHILPEISPAKIDLRRQRSIAVLSVANWIRRKGIHSAVEAVAALPDHCATLHLVGDDNVDPSYAAQVRRRIEEPDVAGRIVVHGPVSLAEVERLYANADVFLLPSLVEPYGTVLGEAMACGLPVVGWKTGNLPFLADDGKEGLLLEPGDITGLTAALLRLSQDTSYRQALGRAAARRAAGRPTWRQSAARYFKAIREALVTK
jgi:glycosyltransferase involved in cell wall biosynthesis